MTRDLRDDVVAVVGGSHGIGKAVAEQAAAAGAEVVVASRDDERRERAVADVGERARGAKLDVSDHEAVHDFFDQVGKLDHLVLTAADIELGGFSDTDPAALRSVFETKFWGYYHATHAAADRLSAEGTITYVTGNAAVKPARQVFPMGVVNGALETMMKYVALELGPVRANCVSPGTVDTFDLDESRKESLRESLPSGRVGHPDDVAEAVLTCLRDEFLTGSTIRVDGGDLLI